MKHLWHVLSVSTGYHRSTLIWRDERLQLKTFTSYFKNAEETETETLVFPVSKTWSKILQLCNISEVVLEYSLLLLFVYVYLYICTCSHNVIKIESFSLFWEHNEVGLDFLVTGVEFCKHLWWGRSATVLENVLNEQTSFITDELMAVRETTWTNLHSVSLILHSRGQYVSLIVTNRKWTASQENCFSKKMISAKQWRRCSRVEVCEKLKFKSWNAAVVEERTWTSVRVCGRYYMSTAQWDYQTTWSAM